MSRTASHSKKKTRPPTEQQREDVVESRRQWVSNQWHLDPDRVVFVDETWAKTNMTRTYGRSPRGERLVDRVPYGRWETTTFLGAMRSTGFVAPLCVEGAIHGALFQAWVEQHLTPVLRPGDIVVMDNLSSHKGAGVAAAIAAVGAEVRYLPPYSPDLNPIELAFSKLKNYSATVPSGPPKSSGNSAEMSSNCSPKTNVATTSPTADTAIVRS